MDSGFNILERIINGTNIRHRVLTSNVANADTPNYKAKDINFKEFVEGAEIEMKTTAPQHIRIASGTAGASGTMTTEKSGAWGDSNNVELDMEIAKMTENGLLHDAGVKLLSSKMRMYRNALRRS
jgi:flagellar basal-body rod protein FlgB